MKTETESGRGRVLTRRKGMGIMRGGETMKFFYCRGIKERRGHVGVGGDKTKT